MKKAMIAVATVIGMVTLSVPVMAATNMLENNPQRPEVVAETAVEMDKMMYVTADLLYVRAIPSTEGEIITSFIYGSRIKVTGIADQKADNRTWYRVEAGGMEGFAAAEFLAENAPVSMTAAAPAATYTAPAAVYTAPAAKQTAPATAPAAVQTATTAAPAGSAPIIKTSYVYEGYSGDMVTIQKDANGNWTDEFGNKLTWITDYDAITEDGEMYASYDPTKESSPCQDEIAPTLEAYWNGDFH